MSKLPICLCSLFFMSKLPNMFSLRHLLVASVALNVSLILRMVYDNEDGPNSCNMRLWNQTVPDAESRTKVPINYKPRHSASTFANSTPCSDDPPAGGRDRVINLDHGDPRMYEKFWRRMGDGTTIIIPGWQSISYFSDVTNICWFLEPEFAKEVVRLHNVVGNAVTEGRYIVVGTGSSQLILAALYALSPPDAAEPISVVSKAPYYSSYPSMTDFQKSGLYKWGGDAKSFEKDGPYIELVTSPNNPDGHTREPVVNRSDGILVHDHAYYWPHYTPISSPSDHDISLFTVSKSTGHAGMRIGWALVKDQEVAKKMTKFIEVNSIGVSKDSQHRAAKILKVVSDSCELENSQKGVSFFKLSYEIMAQRWKQLRAVVEANGLFTLPNFPSGFCNYFKKETENLPAFVWMKCEKDIEDCQSFLREHKILSRGGKHFGVSQRYVRVSMLDTDDNFNLFLDRLSAMQI